MEYGWNILWAIIAISLLVTVHEFGHYWVARRLGFKVLRFSVGFGKPLWKRIGKDADQVEYVIAAIPLGGYVRMLDQRESDVPIPPKDAHRAFGSKPPWKRILVMLAGPMANFIFAIGVLWIMFWVKGELQLKPVVGDVTVSSLADKAGLRSGDLVVAINGEPVSDQLEGSVGLLDAVSDEGTAVLQVRGRAGDGAERTVTLAVPDRDTRFKLTEPNKLLSGLGFDFWRPKLPATVSAVTPGGPAALAGIQAGDTFISVDGRPIRSWNEFSSYVRARPNQELVFEVKRGSTVLTKRIKTRLDVVDGEKVGRLMVETPEPPDLESTIPEGYKTRTHFGPIEALGAGAAEAWQMTVVQAKFFWRMITFKVSTKNLSSVFTIADYAGETAAAGPASFLMLLVMLSLSLGFLNLLPIPILDGGQIVFQIAEWIRGRALSDRTYFVGTQIGLAAIVLLMGVALFNDVSTHLIGPLSK